MGPEPLLPFESLNLKPDVLPYRTADCTETCVLSHQSQGWLAATMRLLSADRQADSENCPGLSTAPEKPRLQFI